jgi:3-deoxy-D-manno-octulosonate 8-phosphate phosphatase (KDO 8-P phosphatase)
MQFLEQNMKGLCSRFGADYHQILSDFGAEHPGELSLLDLEAFAEENETDFYSLLFKPLFIPDHLKEKLAKIKLIILDVDGVMTDAGMYYTESGDQIKKYNAKDGRAIIDVQKLGFRVGIISSAFTDQMVMHRAKVLKIENVYVGERSKKDVLDVWCGEMGIRHDEVAMIGDDINDISIMDVVGVTFCPADAVQVIKHKVDIVLSRKGGEGCVREMIDNFILGKPLGSPEMQ